ncbi:anaerobic ribonucleoside-triphosphate reductase [Heliophilum fasciatum]|uniref:Anaerobic ribonucleoside-triphosphate reductase-like protein n=1 Tax=Heliophilum fasciatum TaxID=35700 RepID=A0A4R2RGB9_9FIRM|nr:anaerobic ribonucleoside-triphosphate reductase [Heliophilum fasciatum]TCP62710.1 anaerobic ribonucleoside-triphosphate reductase-like protein [Heliophilum fasciatum]
MKMKVLDGSVLTAQEQSEIMAAAQQVIEEDKVYMPHTVEVWREDGLCFRVCGEVPIERIRRITGYLSKVNNFNDAKKAELEHRVSHAG